MNSKIQSALISVFYKDGLEPIIQALHNNNVTLYSTGGTRKFIEDLGIPCVAVEDVTGYPSILGGRVKTLHPKVFGGILARRELDTDMKEIAEYQIPLYDLVIVDLYPFAETVAAGGTEQDIIEKIDIGGVSLIRAAAKNHAHTCIVADKSDYTTFLNAYTEGNGSLSLETRKSLAGNAFGVTSKYDTQIANWFRGDNVYTLRYGENPHQKATFNGNLETIFDKIQGKELSYNNLLDVDSAICLLNEFTETPGSTFVIIKHNNACGVATRTDVFDAWIDALSCDPVSAFGGILATNSEIDEKTAVEINNLFFEVLIAPGYSEKAREILSGKTNRIILQSKNPIKLKNPLTRTVLNGELVQERDTITDLKANMTVVTETTPTDAQFHDLEIAIKLVKQTKSNTIVLVKNGQLLASGTGQTSRVDALQQAIDKANRFRFDLEGAVMASDAFFPFPDCVEIADKAGIRAVVQPGGSVKDQLSIDYCNENAISMVFTGVRHFKH